MKKIYSKPEIEFENFSISASIAGDCEHIISNQSLNTCTLMGTGGIAFFDSGTPSLCQFVPGPDQFDATCYHIPDGGPNLFNS